MKDIKTRETIKKVKTIDKPQFLAEHMKNTFVKSKDTAEQTQEPGYDTPENYATDKTSGAALDTAEQAAHKFKNPGKKASKNTDRAKQNFQDAKRHISDVKNAVRKPSADQPKKEMVKRAQNTTRRTASRTRQTANESVKTVQRSEKTIKQSARTIKATGKGAAKTAQKSVKTAERTAKTTIKTTQQAAKNARKTAQAAAKAAKVAAQASRAAVKAAIQAAKIAVKVTIATVKAIIAATKALISVIVAGGWIAVVIILVICVVALIIGSCFGIFFSNDTEQNQNGLTMTGVIAQINGEFSTEIERIKNENPHDEIEGVTTPQNWKEVLAIYAVKCTTDPDNPTDIATVDENKVEIIRTIFWDMNTISFTVETIEPEPEPESSEPSETASSTPAPTSSETEPPPKKVLHITVTGKSHSEIASQYGFNAEQNKQLDDLFKPEYEDMWNALIAGY